MTVLRQGFARTVSMLKEIDVRPVEAAEEARYQQLMQAHHYLGAVPRPFRRAAGGDSRSARGLLKFDEFSHSLHVYEMRGVNEKMECPDAWSRCDE
jgi:hypothetical protein